MKKIKLYLVERGHSTGRGIGFYTQFLKETLAKRDDIELTSVNPDLLHYPFFDLFYPTLPLRHRTPFVVTIHDLIPLTMPERYPLGLRAKINLSRQRLALSRAKMILTDSFASRKDLIRYFHLPDTRLAVTPLAVDPLYQKKVSAATLSRVKKHYQLPDRFILYVGGVNPNKNLSALFAASRSLAVPLILVGAEFVRETKRTFSFKSLFGLQKIHPELAEFTHLQKEIDGISIRALGFVPTRDLVAIYRLATFFCLPSFNEGFGLPLLEALTVGCLTVSSRAGSLPEITPKEAFTFNPADQGEFIRVLARALDLPDAPKQKIIAVGQKQAANFTWAKTAALTIAAYRQALEL